MAQTEFCGNPSSVCQLRTRKRSSAWPRIAKGTEDSSSQANNRIAGRQTKGRRFRFIFGGLGSIAVSEGGVKAIRERWRCTDATPVGVPWAQPVAASPNYLSLKRFELLWKWAFFDDLV